MVHLALTELDSVFQGRWLWSTKRFNVAWFRRADHEGDPREPLEVTIRNLVEARTGNRPAGPITLLTNLRYFGYCMNPVSFYYCWDAARTHVQTIVAEERIDLEAHLRLHLAMVIEAARRRHRAQLVQPQPTLGEAADEGEGFGIIEHAIDLPAQHRGIHRTLAGVNPCAARKRPLVAASATSRPETIPLMMA